MSLYSEFLKRERERGREKEKISIRVESGKDSHHLLVVLVLVSHLGQSANIQSLSLGLISHLLRAVEATTGPLLALELLGIFATRRASPFAGSLLEARAAVLIALLPRLAWADLDLAAADRCLERGESALSSGSLGKVHKAVARVAVADGVNGHVDVLNVVKAIGNEKLLNVLRLEHIVEVACLDQSVFMAAIHG